MTELFFATLKACLGDLTKDLRFLHKPSGTLIAPQIIDVMMDRPTAPVEEGDEYPLVRWMIYEGEFRRMSAAPFKVLVDAGIYTDGSVVEGNAEISRLCSALGGIVENPRFAPYKLGPVVRFTLGAPESPDKNPGVQPHPYYHCRLFLEFLVAGGH